jgi:hypothetical protein
VRQLVKEQKALHDRAAGDAARADELLAAQARLTAATRRLSQEPFGVGTRQLRDAVALQEKAEQAFNTGKLAAAVASQKDALQALEAAGKNAAVLVAQLEEEAAERARKNQR